MCFALKFTYALKMDVCHHSLNTTWFVHSKRTFFPFSCFRRSVCVLMCNSLRPSNLNSALPRSSVSVEADSLLILFACLSIPHQNHYMFQSTYAA